MSLAECPAPWLAAIRSYAGGTAADPLPPKIPKGKQHTALVSFAGTMRRRGAGFAVIFAALKEMNATQLSEPGPEANIRKIAESISKKPAGKTDWAYLNEFAESADERSTIAESGTSPTSQAKLSLSDVIAVFRRWLHLPDVGVLLVVLAVVMANLLKGDPVWLLVVGPPGSGKTEIGQSVSRLPNVHLAATLTEPALLSGTPNREKSSESKGGLLRVIGDFGIILLKDFGSILAMHREQRGSLFAAMREIYDGSWTRHVGVDGGKTLHWVGKVAVIGGCTPAIDSAHAVMSSMGERFLLFRIPQVEAEEQADRALQHCGKEKQMRAEMTDAVSRFFAQLQIPAAVTVSDSDREWLIALSTLVVRCRSSVERDTYSREVELVPDSEAPGRLVIALAQLHAGLKVIGVTSAEQRRLITKVALDCIPNLRRRVFEHLAAERRQLATADIATAVSYPTTTTRRALEDLTCHGLLTRRSTGSGKSDLWEITEWAEMRFAAIKGSVPEMSDGVRE